MRPASQHLSIDPFKKAWGMELSGGVPLASMPSTERLLSFDWTSSGSEWRGRPASLGNLSLVFFLSLHSLSQKFGTFSASSLFLLAGYFFRAGHGCLCFRTCGVTGR